jgi:hypothetical protein
MGRDPYGVALRRVGMVEAEHAQLAHITARIGKRPRSSVHQGRHVMRTHRTQVGLLLCIGLAAALQLSCSSEPTSNEEPSFTHGPSHLTVGGPAEISSLVRRTYTYRAVMDGFYVGWYPWGVRFCPTLSLTSCTTAWTERLGARISENVNEIYQSLVRDCTGGGTRSFQVRAKASAFGQGTLTAYKVTRLCGKEIN